VDRTPGYAGLNHFRDQLELFFLDTDVLFFAAADLVDREDEEDFRFSLLWPPYRYFLLR
jgi:hypothetical protein